MDKGWYTLIRVGKKLRRNLMLVEDGWTGGQVKLDVLVVILVLNSLALLP